MVEAPIATSIQNGKRSVVRLQKEVVEDDPTLVFNQNDIMTDVLNPNQTEFEEHLAQQPEPNVLKDLDTMVNQFAEQHRMPVNNTQNPINQQPQVQQVPTQPSYLNDGKYKNKGSYHIMDLFWLINEKKSAGVALEDNEAEFITMSFNMDFGNLRISYYEIPKGAIYGATVFQQSLKRTVVGTIYPASCFKLINSDSDDMFCMEQLITDTGEQWQKERPWCKISRIDDDIKLAITDPAAKKESWFIFKNWQKKALLHACKFAYKEGFKLHGQNIIANR